MVENHPAVAGSGHEHSEPTMLAAAGTGRPGANASGAYAAHPHRMRSIEPDRDRAESPHWRRQRLHAAHGPVPVHRETTFRAERSRFPMMLLIVRVMMAVTAPGTAAVIIVRNIRGVHTN